MSITPQELQKLLDEREASRASRKRAWENLQEFRWVLKDTAGMDLPPPARKTIDLEGRIVKDGVRKAIQDRQIVLADLVHAFREYRRLAESAPLTLQGSDHAHAVHEMNEVIDRAAARRRKRSESVGLLPTHSFPAWRIQSLVINPSDIRTYPAAFTETEDK